MCFKGSSSVNNACAVGLDVTQWFVVVMRNVINSLQ